MEIPIDRKEKRSISPYAQFLLNRISPIVETKTTGGRCCELHVLGSPHERSLLNRMIEHSTLADDLLHQWPHLRKSERVQAFLALAHESMDDVFLALDARAQAELVLALPDGERRMFVRLLAPDDAADLVQECPDAQREYVMGLIDDATRQEVSALLSRQQRSAGKRFSGCMRKGNRYLQRVLTQSA